VIALGGVKVQNSFENKEEKCKKFRQYCKNTRILLKIAISILHLRDMKTTNIPHST
jgi:Na+/phosphate symporter